MKFFKSASITTLTLLLPITVSCAQADEPATSLSQVQIEKIVKSYLLENPEIIREALILLDEKEDRQSIQAVAKELRHDNRDYSIGSKNAKVTIVEFFDYNCGFCKKSTPWVQEIMAKYPKDIRVVFKELPILDRRTQTSRNAAKAAIAAHKQGKYAEMHFALMEGTGLSKNFIAAAAKRIGLNMKKFEADMQNADVDAQLEDNMYLASRIPGLTGTPFFVINDKFLASGNTEVLQAMLDEALAN